MNDRSWLDKTYGRDPDDWVRARKAMTLDLRGRAQHGGPFDSYSGQSVKIQEICDIPAFGTPMAAILGQINIFEGERDLPWLSGFITHKSGDHFPGVGFWNLAIAVGQFPQGGDKLEHWQQSTGKAILYWRNRPIWTPEPR